ncbi:MAG: DNA-3-methyladenine glycosylase [Candidatus Odinarchaeota archaeon]|nr:DNA-3-methyladenine glycosylase [Candidatus Odinarchaeota archaeon]
MHTTNTKTTKQICKSIQSATVTLGKLLVRRFPDGSFVAGVIVEVEAYRGENDPASHASYDS